MFNIANIRISQGSRIALIAPGKEFETPIKGLQLPNNVSQVDFNGMLYRTLDEAAVHGSPDSVWSDNADEYMVRSSFAAGGGTLIRLGMGESGEHFAVKMYPVGNNTEQNDRILQDYRHEVGLGLDHPHVNSGVDYGTDSGHHFLVSRMVNGVSVRDILDLRDSGFLSSPEECAVNGQQLSDEQRLLRDCALATDVDGRRLMQDQLTAIALLGARHTGQAMLYYQQRGLVHRDIKPENIMLHIGNELGAQSIDHELAAKPGHGGSKPEGTFGYMPPEQANGTNFDHRSDVHALAAVLHEVLTGRTPISTDGTDSKEVLAQRTNEQTPQGSYSGPYQALYELAARGLHKKMDQRPDVEPFVIETEQIIGELSAL